MPLRGIAAGATVVTVCCVCAVKAICTSRRRQRGWDRATPRGHIKTVRTVDRESVEDPGRCCGRRHAVSHQNKWAPLNDDFCGNRCLAVLNSPPLRLATAQANMREVKALDGGGKHEPHQDNQYVIITNMLRLFLELKVAINTEFIISRKCACACACTCACATCVRMIRQSRPFTAMFSLETTSVERSSNNG